MPWKREWLPTPVFLPGKSHRQMSLAGYSPWDCKELDMTEWLTYNTHTHTYTHTHTHTHTHIYTYTYNWPRYDGKGRARQGKNLISTNTSKEDFYKKIFVSVLFLARSSLLRIGFLLLQWAALGRGLLFVVIHRFLIAVASLVADHRL